MVVSADAGGDLLKTIKELSNEADANGNPTGLRVIELLEFQSLYRLHKPL